MGHDGCVQVWPHHRRNLLQVERYHFFPGSMRPVNGISGLLDIVGGPSGFSPSLLPLFGLVLL